MNMNFSVYSAEDGGGAGKAEIKKAIKKLRSLVLYNKQEPEPFRKKLESNFSSIFLPAKVEYSTKKYGNVQCDVLTPEVAATKRTIIYIHGGSFVGGSCKSYKSFCASFAAESSSKIIVPEYRLSPKHPFPAALEDIQAVFRDLYTQLRGSLTLEPEIIIAADGSGASIALALIQTLKGPYRQFVRNIILFSPWLDMSPQSPKILDKKATDGIISSDALRRSGDLYTYESNLTNPLVSPLLMSEEKLTDFPPVYIQCGSNEILLDEIKQFEQKLQANNTPIILDIWPKMVFMFQMAHEFLPQAHLAIQRVAKYIKDFNKTQEEE